MGGISLDDFTQSVAYRESFGRGRQENPAAAPKTLRSARFLRAKRQTLPAPPPPGVLGRSSPGFRRHGRSPRLAGGQRLSTPSTVPAAVPHADRCDAAEFLLGTTVWVGAESTGVILLCVWVWGGLLAALWAVAEE